MGWPIPALGRGLVTVAALVVPIVITLALLPALIAWPFLSRPRQQRLHRLLEMVLTRTTTIITDSRQRGAVDRRQ
ncbi:hypothetical protein [Actinoallomurus iriomotensis]|uniref:Uncharacterized protein n=1 Tax=Actinoallomurus iriomotensis TaxID=478107 RepID=A0A9W6VRF4_9ACTN|nr:hypothetical protein [Actinoallomurus iriomotensis]GLY76462.1 hypothetical protein Airi01_047290 [Actinoallomurus iriomotensis]